MTVSSIVPPDPPRKIPSLLLQALSLPRAHQRLWRGGLVIALGAVGLVLLTAAVTLLPDTIWPTPTATTTLAVAMLALIGIGVWLVVTSRRLSARLLELLKNGRAVTATVRDITIRARGGVPTQVVLELTYAETSGAERSERVIWPFDTSRRWLYADLRKGSSLRALCDSAPGAAIVTLDFPELAAPPPDGDAGTAGASQHELPEQLETAFAAHAEAAEKEVKTQLSAAALASWYEHIRKDAPDFADLVANHRRREALASLEAEAIVSALLCGVMARHGWLDRATAEQAGCLLGQRLRDEIRDSGVSLDSLAPSLGVVIDTTLCTIVDLGRQGSA
jgi:hypothetical protein